MKCAKNQAIIYKKLPFGSSNFSFNLSLHDSFSIGIIKFSSVDKENERKKKDGKTEV